MGKRKRSRCDIVEQVLKKLGKRKRIISSSSSSEEEPKEDNLYSPTQDATSQERQDDDLPPEKLMVDQDIEEDLDPDILQLLGSDPTQQTSYGENLQKDLATRWKHILTNGLLKEEKLELLKNYLPAENCIYMKAPILNPEVKSALSEVNIKKDVFSEQKQHQMSSCISAVGKALGLCLAQKNNIPQEVVKILSDAGRLLCDSHYRESISRRFAIVNSIAKQKRDVIKNTKIDNYLFGSNLSEHLKSSKAISTSASELKFKLLAQPTCSTRNPGALNARGTPRAPAAEPRVYPTVHQSRRPPPPPARALAPRDFYRRAHQQHSKPVQAKLRRR